MVSLAPGAVLGRYTLRRPLGAGGMGEVWVAELRGPAGFAKRVALKLLNSEGSKHATAPALMREARLAATLKHPNIVDVYELGQSEAGWFVAMEMVDGPTVSELVAMQGALPSRALLALARQVCAGLHHAHTAEGGLVHRDLKPSNVLVDRWGLAKIADFGIARRAGTSAVAEGSIGYAAPEQLQGGHVDARSDLFSLGLLLYELATGQSLLRRKRGMETLLATTQLDGLLPAPAARVDDALPGLAAVVSSCLQRDPAKRIASARAVSTALRRLEPLADGPPLVDLIRADEPTLPRMTSRTTRSRGNVPRDSDAFLGRGDLCTRLHALLHTPGVVVTLKGAAGLGKSRTAREVGRALAGELEGGAWLCSLVETRTRAGMLSVLAGALGVPAAGLADEHVAERLRHVLAERGDALIILDQAEHAALVVAALIDELRAQAPLARFLVTSREALGLEGERIIELEPLEPTDAVELLRARAPRWRHVDRAVLEGIARRLDAIPLALELAAARSRVLTPEQLGKRLEDRFRVLSAPGRRGARARTLWSAIAGSWDALEPWEQGALAALSVFRGSFSLEAGQAVLELSAWPSAPWPVEVVSALHDKSMLAAAPGRRLKMFESIRAFAEDRLQRSGDADGARLRHARFFARFGHGAERARLRRPGAVEALRERARDVADLVAAVQHAVALSEPELASRCFVAAADVLRRRGPTKLVGVLGDAVLALEGDGRWRADVLLALNGAYYVAGDLDRSHAAATEALQIARRLRDRRLEARARQGRAVITTLRGALDTARAELEQTLALHRQVTQDRHLIATNLDNLAMCLGMQGEHAAARRCLDEALLLHRREGDQRSIGLSLVNLAAVANDLGDGDEGVTRGTEAVEVLRQVDDRGLLAAALCNVGDAHAGEGRFAEARPALEEAVACAKAVGARGLQGTALGCLAPVLAAEGALEEALEAVDRGIELLRGQGSDPQLAFALCDRVAVLQARGEPTQPTLREIRGLLDYLTPTIQKEVRRRLVEIADGAG